MSSGVLTHFARANVGRFTPRFTVHLRFQTGRPVFLWMFEGFSYFINFEEDFAMHTVVDT